jgi:hemoglobin
VSTLYERVGGEPFFTALVDRFYSGIQDDPLLRPLYPRDLGPPRRRLSLFLMQYFGGPPTYNTERGHPRLRMRHVRFAIGLAQRDAWLSHMRTAVESSSAATADAESLMQYFEMAATSLVNQLPGERTPNQELGFTMLRPESP